MGVAVALIIGMAVVLDRQDPDSSAPEPPRGEAAVLSRADVARIARRVERLRELRFVRPVRPLFASRARAVELLRAATELEYSADERRLDEEALKLVGLLDPDESLEQAVEAVEGEQVLGFYDDRSKRLVVIRETGQRKALLEITLAHELVHALEDQRFGFRAEDDLNDDPALGEKALAEGTATVVMAEYVRRYLKAGDVLAGLGSGAETKLPRYVEKVILFPYLDGEQFVTILRAAGGWRAVDRVWRGRRPQSAEQILHPDKYLSDERPLELEPADLGPALGAGWHRVMATSVGEVDVRGLVDEGAGTPNVRAAEGWGGGVFELWRTGSEDSCDAPCVDSDVGLMHLRWDTPYDRGEAEPVLRRMVERKLEGERAGGAAGITLWRSRGGAIGMAGRARDTFVVFAPGLPIAAGVLGRALSRSGTGGR